MLECSYAKEPFDLRLLVLRLMKRTGLIIGVTLLGVLVFGGGYYLKKVVLQEVLYGAESIYLVEYNIDPVTGNEYTYINDATWNTWVHTDDFIMDMQSELAEICGEEGLETPDLSREEIEAYVSAKLPTSVKMPYSTVITPDPQLSLLIARAAERSFVRFGEKQKDINSIQVVQAAETAPRVISNARPLRACILSGVLTLFLTLIVLALKEMGDDSIWLPATLSGRYGLKAAGAAGRAGGKTDGRKKSGRNTDRHKKKKGGTEIRPDFALGDTIEYLFGGMNQVALTSTDESVDLQRAAEVLKSCIRNERCRNSDLPQEDDRNTNRETGKQAGISWLPVEQAGISREGYDKLRKADGILLVVPAGVHAGKKLEYTLQNLRTQDCQVTAALLWEPDEKLIRRYYFLPYREEG